MNTVSTPGHPARIEIEAFSIDRGEDADEIVYRTDSDDFHRIGDDEGSLMIRIGVDGDLTIVNVDRGQTAPLTLIDQGIESLTAIRDQLLRIAPESSRKGRCLARGGWGRCYGDERHTDEHRFPTEEQFRAGRDIPVAVKAVSA